MEWTIALLVLLTHVTVFQRIHYCWKRLSGGREGAHEEGGQP